MKHRLLTTVVIIVLASGTHAPWLGAKDFDVMELSLNQARQALQNNEVSCKQLVMHYLQRITRYDKATRLNAITVINPFALGRAGQLDAEFAASGKLRSLHCIPVIAKDNFDTADLLTEAGSKALKGYFPPDDATLVQRLREQGAIIVAKSNMGEWAFSPYETISSTHGETLNAYNLSRVPAGSSGGTASAIAANFAIIGLGTDTGNSVRGPASHLALVGLRPSIGALSRDGIVPLLANRDMPGFLTRSVEDTAIVFSQLTAADPADPLTIKVSKKLKPDYTTYLRKNGLKGKRLGVLREAYESESADFAVLDLMDQAIKDLKRAGAVIVDPFKIKAYTELTKAVNFCSRFRHDLNAYLAKAGDKVPVHSLDEIVERKLFLEQHKGAMKWAMDVKVKPLQQSPPCGDVQQDPRRKNLLKAVLLAMDTYKVDAVIYPSWSNPPNALGDKESPPGNNSPLIAPHTGQPAITVPMGYVDGLPAGLQFMARPYAEHTLIQLSYAYEQATRHRRAPPGFERIKP